MVSETDGPRKPERFEIACAHDADDVLFAQRPVSISTGEPTKEVVVGVLNEPAESALYVAMTPADARRFAAEVLNIADAIDGTTPLVFHPPSPTAPEREFES